MYDTLIEFFLLQPTRLIATGRAVFHLGAMVLIAGLIGRIAIAGAAAIQGLSGRVAGNATLATLYPALPTWWVPESAFGYIVCAFAAAAGIAIAHFGRRLERVMGR